MLQERVGSCIVEAMMSRSAPVFYGDIRSHERVSTDGIHVVQPANTKFLLMYFG